jgi:hypothetical protein
MIWLIDDQWFSMMGIIQPIEQGIEILAIFNMNMSLRGAFVVGKSKSPSRNDIQKCCQGIRLVV